MDKPAKNPIIIIPGMMGSIGGDMLPRLGEWRFGVARWIYEPLVQGLEDMGYRLNENLFVCFYDWRRKTSDTAKEYLEPLIEKVRGKHPNKKISLICHSMGGLVARNYLQERACKGVVDRFIMIGTPNKGAAEAYYFWSTGTLPKKDRKSFYNMTYKGFIWVLCKLLNLPMGGKNLSKLHESFKGMEDLLPSKEYGYVLCYVDADKELQMLPRVFMKYDNKHLDKLNNEKAQLILNVEEVYNIVGVGTETNHLFKLEEYKLLQEGLEEIVGGVTTLEGDGTVIASSGALEGFQLIKLQGTHHSIVKESLQFIYNLYGVDKREAKKPLESSLHVIFSSRLDIHISCKGNKILSYKKGKLQTKYEFIYEDFNQEFNWIALKDVPTGDYQLELYNISKQEIHILLMSEGVDEEICEFEEEVEKSSYLKLDFHIS